MDGLESSVVAEEGPQESLLAQLQQAHALTHKGVASDAAQQQLVGDLTTVEEEEFLEEDVDGDVASEAAAAALDVNDVLAKAKQAAAQANKLMHADDDPDLQKAKEAVQTEKKQAEKDEADQLEHIHAMQATAETEAAGKLANATAEANHLMMKVQSQELKGKQLTQQKADALSLSMEQKAADNEKKAAKVLLLAKKVATRLEKAKALEKQARDEKHEAELAEQRMQKVAEVNKEYLLKQKEEAQAALAQAVAL